MPVKKVDQDGLEALKKGLNALGLTSYLVFGKVFEDETGKIFSVALTSAREDTPASAMVVYEAAQSNPDLLSWLKEIIAEAEKIPMSAAKTGTVN